MDKKQRSERDICTKFITPALRQAGWDELTQLREEVTFTKGRVIVRGLITKRGQAKRADYILYLKPNIPLAVIEAKASVGRLALFTDYLGISPIFPDKLIRVRVSRDLATPEFVRLASWSDVVRADTETYCATTVGNWGISASNLQEVRYPLPPSKSSTASSPR